MKLLTEGKRLTNRKIQTPTKKGTIPTKDIKRAVKAVKTKKTIVQEANPRIEKTVTNRSVPKRRVVTVITERIVTYETKNLSVRRNLSNGKVELIEPRIGELVLLNRSQFNSLLDICYAMYTKNGV
jgi:hypothetical protein